MSFPKSINEISLQKWIEFNNSLSLVKQLPNEKKEDFLNKEGNIYLKTYFFWNNEINFEESEVTIKEIIKESFAYNLLILKELDEVSYSLNDLIGWKCDNGEWWKITPIVLGEDLESFEKTQEIALILADLQEGHTEALADLCMSYLASQSGEKLTLESAKTLPLSIVMKVKKYVEDSIIIYNGFSK